MKKWMLRLALGLLGLVLLASATLLVLAHLGERKAQRRVELAGLAPVALPDDAAAVARGGYLFRSRGCTDCHGQDGAGREFLNDGKGLRVRAPNLTPGAGSAVAAYAPLDWVRSIRHGVAQSGRPLLIMPSEDYNRLTDADLGALVAFLRRLPAVDGQPARLDLPLPLRAFYAVGLLRDAAEKIDHTLPPSAPVPETVSAEHGAYVANTCIGCHGAGLSGGRIPGAPPAWPAAANLTPGAGSAMRAYPTAESFMRMMRSGRRPDDSAVSSVMPFSALKQMNDTDLQALYLHLKRLAPRPAGSR